MSGVERASTVALGLCGALAVATVAVSIHAFAHSGASARLAAMRSVVAELDQTDLALFNEARYTRNPNMADLHTAFQDGPMTFDHFPTGSLIAPPAVVTGAGPASGAR